MDIVTQPITGKENKSSNTPYSSLVEFYDSFNNQHFESMEDNWLQTSQASMSNPLGGIKRGWNEIREVYKKIFNGSARVYVEFYDYSIYVTDTIFVAVGRERGALEFENEITDLSIRTSRVYCLHDNRWKQIHHHGSMDNPKLLDKYQKSLIDNQAGGRS